MWHTAVSQRRTALHVIRSRAAPPPSSHASPPSTATPGKAASTGPTAAPPGPYKSCTTCARGEGVRAGSGQQLDAQAERCGWAGQGAKTSAFGRAQQASAAAAAAATRLVRVQHWHVQLPEPLRHRGLAHGHTWRGRGGDDGQFGVGWEQAAAAAAAAPGGASPRRLPRAAGGTALGHGVSPARLTSRQAQYEHHVAGLSVSLLPRASHRGRQWSDRILDQAEQLSASPAAAQARHEA